jgi:hypothetical protein
LRRPREQNTTEDLLAFDRDVDKAKKEHQARSLSITKEVEEITGACPRILSSLAKKRAFLPTTLLVS